MEHNTNQLNEMSMLAAVSHLRLADGRLAALMERVGPCRLHEKSGGRLWVLVSSIVSQQLSNKAASTILARMRALVGHNERLLAARLCKADPSLLKTCGLSAAKLQAITAVASAVASGTLDLDQFDGRSDEEVSVTLREHRGVGPWTVQMFLIFGLHRTDVFAMGDVGLRRGLMLLHGLDAKPTDDMIAELTDHWRPYRTVASWYLWRLLD